MKLKSFLNQPAGHRWIVVDDNPEILRVMQKLLSKLHGAEVEGFSSPLEALAAVKAAPTEFELVITDLEMPGIDGMELGRRMLALAPTLKIFLATGCNFFTEAAAEAKGFSGFLNKPFPVETLYATLSKAGMELETTSLAA